MKRLGAGALRRLFGRFRYRVNQSATVVLGNQKSGTSAIAHLLADACALTKTVDIPEVWPPTMNELLRGTFDLASLARRNREPFSRDIIKEPYLTFIYPQLRRLMPDARIAFVIRDPRDNIRSILNRLEIPGNLNQLEIKPDELPRAWSSFFESNLWGIEYEHYIDILAARWVLAANVYLECPDEMVLIRYEDFLADKTGAIRRLASSLGLNAFKDISDRIDVQFQPKGKDRGIPWETFFGKSNLRRIDDICGRLAGHFSYGKIQSIDG